MAGFLFKSSSIAWSQAFLILGIIVLACSAVALSIRFPEAAEAPMQTRLSDAELVPAGAAAGD
jgi:hypothetical protein